MLSLMPRGAELPHSSLAHMIDVVLAENGDTGSAVCADVACGINEPGLERALRDADRPVCLLGTSAAFVHWLDSLAERGISFRLPPGSRLMDTGGYKGKGREVAVDTMIGAYGERLGIDPLHCVNEYGMTELCSQQYDIHLRDHTRGRVPRMRIKHAPPWLRTRVVDPQSLLPVPDGTPGLLQHFDLANIGSVLAVQTEDVGVRTEDGVTLLGRVTGATPRGCSIAMDDLLGALRS